MCSGIIKSVEQQRKMRKKTLIFQWSFFGIYISKLFRKKI